MNSFDRVVLWPVFTMAGGVQPENQILFPNCNFEMSKCSTVYTRNHQNADMVLGNILANLNQ